MMKCKLFLAAVVGCLCYGCSSENLIDDGSTTTEIGKDEILLNYSIEELAGQTYAVSPLPEEEMIHSVFYIFQNSEGDVIGSSYRDNLENFQGVNLLPIVIPKEIKEYTDLLTVQIICNWDAYLAPNTNINVLHENLRGKKKEYIATLTSLGVNGTPPTFTNTMPMLYTGTFLYQVGSNAAAVQLRRKNIIFDVTVDLNANFTPRMLKVSNLSCATYLFQEKAVTPTPESRREYDVNLPQTGSKRVRVYALPNTKDNVLKMALVAERDVPTRFNDKNMDKVGDPNDPFIQNRSDTIMDISLSVENASSLFYSNQYVPVNVYSTVGKEQQQEMGYTINSWPNGKFVGEYIRDEYGNGVGVTPTTLEFDFVDTTPLLVWTNTTAAPSGKASREIFVSAHSFSSNWEIDAQAIPSWLTIERNPQRSSILVSVEPNFTITSNGGIRSAVRKYTFEVLFKNLSKTVPVTIIQREGPLIPSDVKIGEMFDKVDKVPKNIWLRDRYEQVDRNNPAVTSGFYANIGGSGEGVGDLSGRETPRSSRTAGNGYIYSRVNISDVPNETLRDPLWPDDEVTERPRYSIYTKCTPGYEMISIEEATMLLFPRLKCREILLNGQAALMYYVTDGENLCFVNLTGLGFPGSYYSPAVRIYASARNSDWRYNEYPPYSQERYGTNSAGEDILHKPSTSIYCFYGMELGYTRRALAVLVDGTGLTRNVIDGMLRCVKKEVKK